MGAVQPIITAGRLPVARVALLGLLSPVVAATLGWAALGQSLSAGQLGGMILVLASVVHGQRRPEAPASSEG